MSLRRVDGPRTHALAASPRGRGDLQGGCHRARIPVVGFTACEEEEEVVEEEEATGAAHPR